MRAVARGADAILDELYRSGNDGYPELNGMTGGYRLVDTYKTDGLHGWQWIGFLVGKLWLLYRYAGEARYRDGALRIAGKIGPVLAGRPATYAKEGNDTHYALCVGYEATGDEGLKNAALAATANLAPLFQPKVGIYFMAVGRDVTNIDTALNFLPCFWAERFVPGSAQRLVQHFHNVIDHGYIRPDGSTFQAVTYDLETGQPVRRHTLQGYSDASTWTRGQAWGMHNFTNAFEGTGEPRFLDMAVKLSNWYIAHLPEDWVPYYDFDDPERSTLPRDSCSAAIATNALIRLARLRPELAGSYRPVIEATLAELVDNYLTQGGVLLHGTWGHEEKGFSRLAPQGHVRRTGRFPQEDVMPYGNYFVSECLFRELVDEWSILNLGPMSPR